MAFRVLFAIAAFFDLEIDQMDVKTAFLYGLIDQLVYVEIPKGIHRDKFLSKSHLDKAHSVNTPMKETALLEQRTDGEASPSEKERYQGMTGSLTFSMIETRPDIAFAISVASRFAKNPGHQHTEAVKTILQYLKGSRERGITYGGQSKLLHRTIAYRMAPIGGRWDSRVEWRQ